MTISTIYDNLNNLTEMSFIGGTYKVLTFNCFDDDGVTPLTISGGTIVWRLCPYGEFSVNTLQKSGSIVTASSFTVTLADTDTITLNGKYIQQVIVTDFYGDTFRPAQGIVLIFPAIVAD